MRRTWRRCLVCATCLPWAAGSSTSNVVGGPARGQRHGDDLLPEAFLLQRRLGACLTLQRKHVLLPTWSAPTLRDVLGCYAHMAVGEGSESTRTRLSSSSAWSIYAPKRVWHERYG